MRIAFIKPCLLLSGLHKAKAVANIEDGLARRLIAKGIAREAAEKKPASAARENKAEEPSETK